LTGTALVWLVRNQLGAVAEMYILPTALVTPRGPSPEYPDGGYWLSPIAQWGWAVPVTTDSLWMAGTLGTAMMAGIMIPARDVKPIRWPHPVFLTDGQSPLAAGSVWVDCAGQIDLACFYGLQNTERPGMMFSVDPSIAPAQEDVIRFREDIKADSAGVPNTGRHLVLPPGVTADTRSRPPAEMDYPDGRTAYRDANLALHAVAPVACGISEAGNYGALWAGIKQTTELSVQPILSLIAGELSEVLSSQPGVSASGARVELTLTAPAIDDPQLLEQRLRTDIQAGNAVTVNEYRALRGLPPLPPDKGDQFVGQSTSVSVEDVSAEPGLQSDEEKPDEKRTGNREPQRNAPPGRQDRNGKAFANGHSRAR
jgi:hypothetical protein